MTDKLMCETRGGSEVKRGYTFDPECHRTTHRYRVARGILAGLDVEATYPEHDETCILHPGRQTHRCYGVHHRCECGVGTNPPPIWPEWATGAMFDLAWKLADEVQTERGGYHRYQASVAKCAADDARARAGCPG